MSQHLPKYWRFSFIIRPSNEGLPFISRLLSFSLFLSLRWYHLHIWGYWYVSIPACDSSSPTFWMTHFTCKLNKQDDDIQPCHIPFPILNQPVVPCTILIPCFFYDPVDIGNLISGSSAFSKSSVYIWKFSVHIRLKLSLENFEYYLASMWNECSCAVVWIFFGIAFLWDWNENWPFSVLWPLLNFPNLLT